MWILPSVKSRMRGSDRIGRRPEPAATAMLAAMRRASSRVSRWAAERRPSSSSVSRALR